MFCYELPTFKLNGFLLACLDSSECTYPRSLCFWSVSRVFPVLRLQFLYWKRWSKPCLVQQPQPPSTEWELLKTNTSCSVHLHIYRLPFLKKKTCVSVCVVSVSVCVWCVCGVCVCVCVCGVCVCVCGVCVCGVCVCGLCLCVVSVCVCVCGVCLCVCVCVSVFCLHLPLSVWSPLKAPQPQLPVAMAVFGFPWNPTNAFEIQTVYIYSSFIF